MTLAFSKPEISSELFDWLLRTSAYDLTIVPPHIPYTVKAVLEGRFVSILSGFSARRMRLENPDPGEGGTEIRIMYQGKMAPDFEEMFLYAFGLPLIDEQAAEQIESALHSWLKEGVKYPWGVLSVGADGAILLQPTDPPMRSLDTCGEKKPSA